MPRSQAGLARLVRRRGVPPHVAQLFQEIDRADFVPDDLRSNAYDDRPVVLPEGQTTSQPSLIAHMVGEADPRPGDRVLEIGTGYGFQTALLARLSRWVVSVERHEALARAAERNLVRAGIDNVEVHVGDGWEGWPQGTPYDAIVVSAAAEGLPGALAEQLAEGGRLVIPLVGPRSDDVILFTKTEGQVHRVKLISPARFVPLVKDVQT